MRAHRDPHGRPVSAQNLLRLVRRGFRARRVPPPRQRAARRLAFLHDPYLDASEAVRADERSAGAIAGHRLLLTRDRGGLLAVVALRQTDADEGPGDLE